ncbi:calcineurin B homologous protein 1-like [Drosophila bipectinata]|uniref:calcineurin B homologous protein 1-like n=1 Tax=Drosophila bipectinata TaxID=42026 RepID=UPI001C8A0780|nr:calcineurin subunit B-like [Drosophila bipectinata]
MGTAASRHLSAQELIEIQEESGFSLPRIDYLYGQYQSLDRDSEDRVLRSELLRVPPVARHPLAERLVDALLHPSLGFRHFVRGLAHFRRSEPLERKLAAMLLLFDEDGDGLLSADQCHALLARLPATRRELRAMRWRLNQLLAEKSPEMSPDSGKLDTVDFAYITRGLDLEQSLSLRFH